MVTLTVSTDAIEYAVIELDRKLAELRRDQKDLAETARILGDDTPEEISVFWGEKMASVEASIDECSKVFNELRSILVGLADQVSVTVIVQRGEELW